MTLNEPDNDKGIMGLTAVVLINQEEPNPFFLINKLTLPYLRF